MIGLKIKGKSYNFIDSEISINDKVGEVISIEKKSINIWVNKSNEMLSTLCDIFVCVEEYTNLIIEIPAFLITSIIDKQAINNDIIVSGNPTVFYSSDRKSDFTTETNKKNGFIVGKYLFPHIIWENIFSKRILTSHYYLICYPQIIGTSNPDYNSLIFLEESKIEKNKSNITKIREESIKKSSNPPIRGIDGKDGKDGKDADISEIKIPEFYSLSLPPEGTGSSSIIKGSIWYNTSNAKTYIYVHSDTFYWLLISDTSK